MQRERACARAAPPQNATVPASSTPSTQQNATQPQPGKPSQSASQGFSALLVIAIIVGIVLALAGYILYKRRYRYVS
jgi:heme/copper-type cytochrome/quinol oxidase subunit 2